MSSLVGRFSMRSKHEASGKRGGVALSATALLVMSGTLAAADDGRSDGEVVIHAIEAVDASLLDGVVSVRDAGAPIATKDGGSAVLPTDAADGVVLASADGVEITIDLPFSEQADTAELSDGVLVFDNNNGSATTPLVRADGSVQILTTIEDASAPSEYAYDFGPGTSFEVFDTGEVAVVHGGPAGQEPVALIEAPWAVDAHGQPVDTHFEARGSELVQVVDIAASGVAFPVVADPEISYGWWRYLHFNRSETKTIAGGGWSAAAITAICSVAGGPAAGAACLAQVGSIVYTAGLAENSSPKRCLVVKFTYISPVAISGTYRDSRCR